MGPETTAPAGPIVTHRGGGGKDDVAQCVGWECPNERYSDKIEL